MQQARVALAVSIQQTFPIPSRRSRQTPQSSKPVQRQINLKNARSYSLRAHRSSAEKVVLQDTIDCSEPVPPADLLSMGIGAPIVTDTDLVNAASKFCNLRCYFGFEAEAILFNRDFLDDIAAKNLVARFHVREVEISKHIGERCQEKVAHFVPVIKYAMGLSPSETRSINNIGVAAL